MSLPIKRLEIITDEKLLRQKSRKISKWQGTRLGMKLIKFIAHNDIQCVGLAAPQVDIYERVFVIYDGKEYAIFINPRIIEIGPLEDTQIESCISIPGRQFNVKRPTTIVVKDAVRTKPFSLDGWTSRIWLHEFSHTLGQLISDKTGLYFTSQELVSTETSKYIM